MASILNGVDTIFFLIFILWVQFDLDILRMNLNITSFGDSNYEITLYFGCQAKQISLFTNAGFF